MHVPYFSFTFTECNHNYTFLAVSQNAVLTTDQYTLCTIEIRVQGSIVVEMGISNAVQYRKTYFAKSRIRM